MNNPLDKVFLDSIKLEIKIASSSNTEENSLSRGINWAGRLKSIGETDKCPYCKKQQIKIPGRKKKCEFCGEFIYVRTRPSDRKKVLVTEKQVGDIERQWAEYHHLDEWIRRLSQWGITEKNIMKHNVTLLS